MLTLTTRATSAKRARKAPERPDFELAEVTRTPIRKKPRPKTPRMKKKKKQEATAPDEELAQTVEGAFAYDEVMRDLTSHFDGAVQPGDSENFPGHEDSMLLPQFDPDCAPRTMGPWSAAEDDKLMSLVHTIGAKNWPSIAKRMAGRTNKQCRERWHNHLNPELSRDAWTIEEDLVIHRAVNEFGHKWSEIAGRLRGRTDSAVKNRYNGRLKSMSVAAIRKKALCDTPTTELMHELVRRNALAEEERRPGRFSVGHVQALTCRSGEAYNTSGCRWSNDEHARLSHAIPDGVPISKIDWFAASRAVPTRTTVACRRHWESYLRGGWKSSPFRGLELEPRPEPEPVPEPVPEPELVPESEPTFGVDVDAEFETLTTHGDLFVEHANDPKQLALMAFETYDEGSDSPAWSHSSVLVVGKPGLTFAFAARGKTIPSPPPPADVIARPVSSPAKLETAERWEWVKKKLSCSAWAPPMDQWQCAQEEESETAQLETSASRTPWHRRSRRRAWQYYKQKKPRCTDVAGELAKTAFV